MKNRVKWAESNPSLDLDRFDQYDKNMIKFKRLVKLWLPVICWAALIFYLSSIPNLRSGLEQFWDTILRKIAHMVEFGILFLLLIRAFNSKPLKNNLIWAIILSILYAISDEWHQNFILGRQCSLRDVCFDTAGILIGYLIIKNKFKNHNSKY